MTGLPQIDGVTDLVEIGRGGFGVVYRGTETEFGRDVAVKVLMPSLDDRARRRFERERRAMGTVSSHPNIVTVFRGGTTPSDQPYLVMEFLPGGSLADRLDTVGPLDWREAASIGAKLADALTHAHRAGVLHRDVKPGNIFSTVDGEPMLGDFGIARLDDGHESRTGSITASIAHAPPEIVDGQRGDERSDLYSLASTIYALTRGTAPFSRADDQGMAAMLARIANETPPGLHLESAADNFEAALTKALSKNPQDRHDTVAAFGNDLVRSTIAPITEPVVSGLVASAPPRSEVESPPANARQTSIGQIAVLGFLAILIAGFGGWAVARAVFGTDDTEPVEATAPTVQPDPTQPPEPTAVPPEPTAPPTPEPPTVEPTTAPTATPSPEPTPAATGGGARGSDLGGTTAGFTRVSDFSGAITVDVPSEWASEVHDSSELDSEDLGFAVRLLAAGGSLQALSGDPEIRDLTVSGIYVFAARLDDVFVASELLDGALDFWVDCEQGARSQILLPDGNAEFQLLACERPDGESSGVVALTLAPDEDPMVGVSVFLQFAEQDDLDSLETVLSTLRIDTEQVPAATS